MHLAQARWITNLRLVLALIVLASAILRPPGTMIERYGDSITYVICTGAEVLNITVSLGDGGADPVGSERASCDLFAHQVATAPEVASVVLPLTNQAFRRVETTAEAIFIASTTRRAHTPRGPPALI